MKNMWENYNMFNVSRVEDLRRRGPVLVNLAPVLRFIQNALTGQRAERHDQIKTKVFVRKAHHISA